MGYLFDSQAASKRKGFLSETDKSEVLIFSTK